MRDGSSNWDKKYCRLERNAVQSKDLQIDMGKSYFVYILTNNLKTVLYIGMTNNLLRRLQEHRNGKKEGFSKSYQTKTLIYFEVTTDVLSAISREKQLKGWSRTKKEELIEKLNPYWKDLSENLFDEDFSLPRNDN